MRPSPFGTRRGREERGEGEDDQGGRKEHSGRGRNFFSFRNESAQLSGARQVS